MWSRMPCECGLPMDIDADYAPFARRHMCECGRAYTWLEARQWIDQPVRQPHIDRPVMHIMSGVPGSGKSTLVRRLSQVPRLGDGEYTAVLTRMEGPVVNPDSIRLACGAAFDPANEARVWDSARLQAAQHLIYGAQHVWIDATNISRAHRDRWRYLADEMYNLPDYEVVYHVLQTPVDVCRRRRAEMVHVVDRMQASYEPLTPAEVLGRDGADDGDRCWYPLACIVEIDGVVVKTHRRGLVAPEA